MAFNLMADGGESDFPGFEQPDDYEGTDSLDKQLVEQMVSAWKRGERLPAETYLSRYPEIEDDAAIRLIFEEFSLRTEEGLEADPVSFEKRFPRWWPDLELLLDCRRLMETPEARALLPSSGEEIAGFRLLAELGRGASGRVFLASQAALADRPVVLKIAPIGRDEHLSLARLQHMHIVPLYSEQVLRDRELQILCMPFLGGASMAQVLDCLKEYDPARRTGSQIIETLDVIQSTLPVAVVARSPFRRHLSRSSYVEAVVWIGVCLADGLQYAHDRNFVHMDVKPSNVLLAGDGQPMLLDFHLAREPISAGDPPLSQMGGTPGYMAPEHEEAMKAVQARRPMPCALDGRADIFSLGILLREALGGVGPGPTIDPRGPLYRCNPRVSVGLSDIIEKCLRPDPKDRYGNAGLLAVDLRRFLDGRSLVGVPNRSPIERWRNWRRRSPHALVRSLISLGATLIVVGALVLLRAAYLHRVEEVEATLIAGRAYLDQRQYPEATKALNRGLALSANLPSIGGYQPDFKTEIARVQRQSKAEDLHRVAELVRFRYGIAPPPPEEADILIRRGRAIWKDRELLVSPVGGPIEPEADRIIRADLLDLTLAWVNLRVRQASSTDVDQAKQEVLRVLDEAEKLLGQGAAIDREKQTQGATNGQRPVPPIRPSSAWEHFELGKSLLRSGKTSEAAEQFRLGLILRPQDFWLNFYDGLCAYRQKRFEAAVASYRVCIALSPESPECYFNRAIAFGALSRSQEAINDYSKALQLNPVMSSAALNRGMLRYEQGQFDEAASDLYSALSDASSREARGLIHYNLSLVEMARGDRLAARSNLEQAARYGNEAAIVRRDRFSK